MNEPNTSDYPTGSYGCECDKLDAKLAALARTPGLRAWPLRVWARRKQKGLAEHRRRLYESLPAQLEAGGFITPEMRRRMDQLP